MTTRAQLAWLLQRAAFGPATGQLDAEPTDQLDGQPDGQPDGQADGQVDGQPDGSDPTSTEPATTAPAPAPSILDRLVDPDAHGVAAAPDPWADLDLSGYDPKVDSIRDVSAQIIQRWLTAMATTPRPLEEWMRWFWHGHFVSTVRVVKLPPLMVTQLRTFGRLGLGDFPTLLRAVTTDPAMLIYLDGITNLKGAVNENYGREVLELFALGVGNYGEQDVRAGATALTGYRLMDRTSTSATGVFDARRHDDTPQSYLGTNGVHDLDTVIAAIVAHPACAPFITATLADALLGPGLDADVVDQLAGDFKASGLQLRPLVRAILQAGLDGKADELAVAPVPALVAMVRATASESSTADAPAATTIGAGVGGTTPVDAKMLEGLVAAGQLPLDAPNVAGWPGGRAWLSSSTTVARFNLAARVATAADRDAPARQAARDGDLDALADRLGRPIGFTDATKGALAGLADDDPKGTARLAVALSSPDLAISPPC